MIIKAYAESKKWFLNYNFNLWIGVEGLKIDYYDI